MLRRGTCIVATAAVAAACGCAKQEDSRAVGAAPAATPTVPRAGSTARAASAAPANSRAVASDPVMTSPAPVRGVDGRVKIVNARCPIMGEHELRRGSAEPELTRLWRGQTVGFCCEDCPAAWDGLSDDEKDAALKGAMK